MMNSYCHADASEQARWFGDDIRVKGEGFEMLDMTTPRVIAILLRRVGSHGSGMDRARRVAALPLTAQRLFNNFMTTHSTLGAEFAQRIGLDESVSTAIRHAYEQWDGKGPQRLRGEEICLPARLVQLASPIEVYSRRRGWDAARTMTRKHRSTQFDASIVDVFFEHTSEVLEGLDEAAEWDELLKAAPERSRTVAGEELDCVLEAMADLVDLKSPYLAGHSRGVANLASAAGRRSGLPPDEVQALRRAGLIHDLGRLGVSNAIWDKPDVLRETEVDRVRMHPHLTERMLARIVPLSRSREIASRHHERLDGSGYPRGLGAAALGPADRLLAAADVFHAMTEPRPHRQPLEPERATRQIQAEVRAGRLDGDAVNAVLAAAGQRAPARREWPRGLTAREVEVLALVARGHTNKEIAKLLFVTPKTASNHIEHIYAKLGVSSRAAATLFATQHGLTGHFEPA
jgi:HD-GYP domain-containing protein (c-di-GMP phosphodiesterase class II)